jgi:hypothetical protein
LEELSKATKTLRELRRVLPGYKSTALPLQQPAQFTGIAKQFPLPARLFSFIHNILGRTDDAYFILKVSSLMMGLIPALCWYLALLTL